LRGSWALCNLIFFDDYSSVLIVGNSIRSALKELGAPPERLGLIIHTMGISLTSISPVSSWIGLQLGYVAAVYKQLELPTDPFVATMRSIPYRFLPLLLLLLVPVLLSTGKDIGPMASYPLPACPPAKQPSKEAHGAMVEEADAGGGGPLEPKRGVPYRAINALLPFSTIALVTFGGMLYDGSAKISAMPAATRPPLDLVSVLSASDSVNALVWSSAAGWLTSMFLVISQGVLTLSEAVEAWVEGMKDVLEPTFVLLLAWSLGDVIGQVGTADFLAKVLHTGLPAWSFPALVAILAHVISYACGSSFGTMGIILPLVGPLAHSLGNGDPDFLLHCIGAVLGVSVERKPGHRLRAIPAASLATSTLLSGTPRRISNLWA
jgi:Na+/H+ antiporter NhaC